MALRLFELHIYSPSTCFLQPLEGGTTIRATSHPGTNNTNNLSRMFGLSDLWYKMASPESSALNSFINCFFGQGYCKQKASRP